MGLRNGYQVRPDLVTRAECIKVSRGAGIPERTVTYSYFTMEFCLNTRRISGRYHTLGFLNSVKVIQEK